MLNNTGFKIYEEMIGTHEFISNDYPKVRHPFSFNITWRVDSIVNFFKPKKDNFLLGVVEGIINIGGLADNIPLKGTMELRYFKDKKIRYTLYFIFDKKSYKFIGEKVNIKFTNLVTSHTTCFGTIVEVDTLELISRSVTHFRLQDTVKFISSFRFI